jgi:hypothetical protein
MDIFIDLIKILGPALIVLYAVYLMLRSFQNARLDEIREMARKQSVDTLLPNRLQAYERMVLFLERITPNNLIPRLNNGQYTAKEFQQILIHEIRQEYQHNLAQQIYISEQAWLYLTSAVEDTVTSINEIAMGLEDEATSLDLAKGIFESGVTKQAIAHSISYLKKEVHILF